MNQQTFNNLWDPNDNHVFFTSSGAQPTQPAPFFQPSHSNYTSHRKSYSQDNFFGTTKQQNFLPFQQLNLQSQPITSTVAYRQAMLPPQREVQSSSKRQRIDSAISNTQQTKGTAYEEEESGAASECCSSCPDGEICTESNCAPWDDVDIDHTASGVIPCSRQSCAEDACPAPCLTAGIEHQRQYETREPKSNVGSWVDSTWQPQTAREFFDKYNQSQRSFCDPHLAGFEPGEYLSAAPSPAPTTPSMVINVETPFSPNPGLPTPQYSTFQQSQDAYSNPSVNMLSGTGDLYTPVSGPWSNQYGQFGNDTSIFHCTWNGCGQTIMNPMDWLPHLHSQHIDPQMTFNCPIQQDSCPPTISDNPLDHLQKDHGYNFDLDDGNIGCPDPTCIEGGEVFCNPAMLHHHFDNVHAIPNQGTLHCQIDTCDTFFQGLDQLQMHFINDHQLPVAPPKDNDINLQSTLR